MDGMCSGCHTYWLRYVFCGNLSHFAASHPQNKTYFQNLKLKEMEKEVEEKEKGTCVR